MDVVVTTKVKRVGNSLALFIPAEKAREGHLKEGDVVTARLEADAPVLLGLAPNLPAWSASKQWLWPDE